MNTKDRENEAGTATVFDVPVPPRACVVVQRQLVPMFKGQ